jgi:hypothetical protein
MVEAPRVGAFRDGDRFLRRIRLPDHIRRGLVYWRGFKDKGSRLSFTFQDESLSSDVGLDAYRRYVAEKYMSGDLPGICWLSYHGLVSRLDPALEPQHDPDSTDFVYGHLHCSTAQPRDKEHMEKMAKLVNDGDYGGLLRDYVRATG